MSESKKKTKLEALSYEQAVTELENIVKKLEDGNLTLEESLKLYEKGMKLSDICRKTLEEAELRIKTIQDGEEIKDEIQ